MNIKYQIDTKFNHNYIELTDGFKSDHENIFDQTRQNIINLRDQAIRDALNKLGWLSPEDALALLNACSVFQDGFAPHSMHYKQARKDFEKIMKDYHSPT